MRLAFALAAAAGLLPFAAVAAPGCMVSSTTALMNPGGAKVTMQVSSPGRACGARLWVQPGVIPFNLLQQTNAPKHGHLTVSDPTQFTYEPNADYRGPDSFEIIARGNNRGGGQVTGTLHVDVMVTGQR